MSFYKTTVHKTICVYVPENDVRDTTYIHFYLHEMHAARKTRDFWQGLCPSANVRITERVIDDLRRVEDDRVLRHEFPPVPF